MKATLPLKIVILIIFLSMVVSCAPATTESAADTATPAAIETPTATPTETPLVPSFPTRLEWAAGAYQDTLFSLDGMRAAVVRANSIVVGDTTTNTVLATIDNPAALQADLSADGTRLVTADVDGNIRMWDAGTGKLLYTVNTPALDAGINIAPVFTADGDLFLTAQNMSLSLRNAQDGSVVHQIDISGERVLLTASLSPNGQYAAASFSDSNWALYDLASGDTLVELPLPNAWPEITFSADNRWLLVGYVSNGEFLYEIWDVATKSAVDVLQAYDAFFSPGGRFLVQEYNQTTTVYNMDGEEPVKVYEESYDWSVDQENEKALARGNDITFSNNDEQVAVSLDYGTSHVLYDTNTWESTFYQSPEVDNVLSEYFRSDGALIAIQYAAERVNLQTVTLQEGEDVTPGCDFSGVNYNSQLLWSNNERFVFLRTFEAADGMTSTLLDAQTCEKKFAVSIAQYFQDLYDIAPDNSLVAVGEITAAGDTTLQASVHVLDLETGAELYQYPFTFDPHEGLPDLSFSPDSQTLLIALSSTASTTYPWIFLDARSGQVARTLDTVNYASFQVEISPDNSTLAVLLEEEIILANAQTGAEVRSIGIDKYTSAERNIAFTSNGAWLAIPSEGRLFNVSTGTDLELATHTLEGDAIPEMLLSPDGRYAAVTEYTAAEGTILSVWELATAQLVGARSDITFFQGLQFSTDSQSLYFTNYEWPRWNFVEGGTEYSRDLPFGVCYSQLTFHGSAPTVLLADGQILRTAKVNYASDPIEGGLTVEFSRRVNDIFLTGGGTQLFVTYSFNSQGMYEPGNNSYRWIDLASGKSVKFWPDTPQMMGYYSPRLPSPDGTQLVYTNGGVGETDVAFVQADGATQTFNWTIPRGNLIGFSPDGTSLVMLTGNSLEKKYLSWVNISTGQPIVQLGLGDGYGIYEYHRSPDGRLVEFYFEQQQWVVDLASQKILAQMQGERFLGFSGDSQQTYWYSGDGIIVRPTDSTTSIQPFAMPEGVDASHISVMTTNPANTTLILGDEFGNVSFWDLTSTSFLAQVRPHSDEVTYLLLTPDGSTIVSASRDGGLKIWDSPIP